MAEERLDAFPEYATYLEHHFLLLDRIRFLTENIIDAGDDQSCVPSDSNSLDISLESGMIEVSWSGWHHCEEEYHCIKFPTSYLTRDIEEINRERRIVMVERIQKQMHDRRENEKVKKKEIRNIEIETLKELLKKYPEYNLRENL